MEQPTDDRCDVLVGEALKLMLEAGASATVIGRVATKYPAIVAANLEPPPPPPSQEVELESLVRTVVKAVLAEGRAPTQKTVDQRKPGVKYNVLVNGKRTTLKVRAELNAKLVEVRGTDKVAPLIQSFVTSAPADCSNRSDWVEEQVTQHIVMQSLAKVPATVRH